MTDVEFVWENSDASKTNNPTTHFKNIPVQRNYRTNIIGKLLTNPATFNIVIDADFIDSPENDYIVSVWDGESATTPVADADGVYRISSAEELVGMMNDSKYPNCNNYQNVVLECDIDLGGNTISGFGDDSGFFDGILTVKVTLSATSRLMQPTEHIMQVSSTKFHNILAQIQ